MLFEYGNLTNILLTTGFGKELQMGSQILLGAGLWTMGCQTYMVNLSVTPSMLLKEIQCTMYTKAYHLTLPMNDFIFQMQLINTKYICICNSIFVITWIDSPNYYNYNVGAPSVLSMFLLSVVMAIHAQLHGCKTLKERYTLA